MVFCVGPVDSVPKQSAENIGRMDLHCGAPCCQNALARNHDTSNQTVVAAVVVVSKSSYAPCAICASNSFHPASLLTVPTVLPT